MKNKHKVGDELCSSSRFCVDKEKCIGCGTCVAICPEAVEFDQDGKAKIIDSEKLDKCGGKNICPMEAIIEM